MSFVRGFWMLSAGRTGVRFLEAVRVALKAQGEVRERIGLEPLHR